MQKKEGRCHNRDIALIRAIMAENYLTTLTETTITSDPVRIVSM
jgi:hypothetical protein